MLQTYPKCCQHQYWWRCKNYRQQLTLQIKREKKSFVSTSTTISYFAVRVSGFLSVWLCVYIHRKWMDVRAYVCVCLLFVSSFHFPPTASNHLKFKWIVHSVIEIACLDCSEPHNHMWKHYSWKTGHYPEKLTEKCFVGIRKLYNSWTSQNHSLNWCICSATASSHHWEQ